MDRYSESLLVRFGSLVGHVFVLVSGLINEFVEEVTLEVLGSKGVKV